jgi:prepilin peptidase CpaA
MLDALVVVVFPLLMIFACLSDLLTQLIPNRVSILLFVVFCVLAVLLQLSWRDFGLHLACGFGFLSFAFALFSLGWIGGGDGKLAASVALWLGFPVLLEFIVTVSLLGGGLALLLIAFRRIPLPAMLLDISWIARLHDDKGAVPYGIAIGFAGLQLYPQSIIWVTYMQTGIR